MAFNSFDKGQQGKVFPSIQVGQSQSYLEIDHVGRAVRYGEATLWDDLPPVPIIVSKLGVTAPTLATFVSDIDQYTFAVNDYVIGSTEAMHGWKEGSTIYPHVHWAVNGTDITDRGVKWELKYTLGGGNAAFSAQATTVVDATITTGLTDRTHLITGFDTPLTMTNLLIGTYIVWRLTRIATSHGNGDPSNDPFAIAIGFHGEMDTDGSRGLVTK